MTDQSVPSRIELQLSPEHLRMVREVLAHWLPDAQVLAFGSRVTGAARKFSDLDLAIVSSTPLDWRLLGKVRDAFEDSDLPMCVDLVDWSQADAGFKAMVGRQGMVVLRHNGQSDCGVTKMSGKKYSPD